MQRTEGWPVGLYLATLATGAGNADGAIQGLDLHGNDRIVADYLRAEVMSALPGPTARFLVRCSVLDSLCGPLCDAVMGATGSQEVLEGLEASNLLVVPLDRQRRWYRCHHLLRDLLRDELERSEPKRFIPRLHDRAAAWFDANERPGAHARARPAAAGDADRAPRACSSRWRCRPTARVGSTRSCTGSAGSRCEGSSRSTPAGRARRAGRSGPRPRRHDGAVGRRSPRGRGWHRPPHAGRQGAEGMAGRHGGLAVRHGVTRMRADRERGRRPPSLPREDLPGDSHVLRGALVPPRRSAGRGRRAPRPHRRPRSPAEPATGDRDGARRAGRSSPSSGATGPRRPSWPTRA